MKYDIEYFKNKFSMIPDEKWIVLDLERETDEGVCHCALGWCGVRSVDNTWVITEEAKALANTLKPVWEKYYKTNSLGHLLDNEKKYNIVYSINDSTPDPGKGFLGNTPKERILNALAEAEALAK